MSVGRPGERGAVAPDAPSVRELVRQVKWLGAGEAVGQAAWYVMVLVLAAILSPRAFGTVAAGMAIVNIANLITQAGTGGTLIAARALTPGDVRAAVRRMLVGAAVFTVLLAVAGAPLSRLIAAGGDPNVLRVLGLSVTLAALAAVPLALLRKALDFKRASTINGTAAVVTSIVAVGAALLGAGVWSLVVRQVLFELLLAVLLWLAARNVLPRLLAAAPPDAPFEDRPGGRADRMAFLVVAASFLLAMSMDNVVVGATLDARQLGYYALAFSIAFAPLTQISWRLGTLLFPAAAATRDLRTVGRRTVSIARVTALLLFPLVPAAAILAPAIVPAVLGEKWAPIVAPFQILLTVGALHAVTNVIGESLSGTGNIRRRAVWDAAWAVLTIGGVALLAHLSGIRGAATAHLVSFLPLGALYVLLGTRLIGTSPGELWRGMRDVLAAVAAQALVTVGVAEALGGPRHGWVAAVAAVAGLTTAVALLTVSPSRPLRELAAVGRLVRSGGAGGTASAQT